MNLISKRYLKTFSFYLILTFVSLFLSASIGEIVLRVFWKNPYSISPLGIEYKDYVRLQLPDVDVTYDISGLYENSDKVRFRTESKGNVKALTNNHGPLAYVYGGSTTECRYIPEGKRWPEKVNKINSVNWGVSGNNLIDSYFNFKYHLDNAPIPKYAVFMHAVNDFSARNVFTPDAYLKALGESRQSNKSLSTRFFFKDFGITVYNNLFTELNVKKRIVQSKQSVRNLKPLNQNEFNLFVKTTVHPFLRNRTEVLTKILDLAKYKGVEIILITQPNAYGTNYKSKDINDLRDNPILDNNYYLSHQQIAVILEMVNQNTRQFSEQNQVKLIDVSYYFDMQDVSDFFYDGVHYTEKGSIEFANIINQNFPF